MEKTKIRFSSLIALILVFCLLITSCGNKGNGGNTGNEGGGSSDSGNTEGGGNEGGENEGGGNTACTHANTVITGQKEATCTEEGYTGDKKCTDCTATVVAGTVIPKTEHSYGEYKVTKKPTCISTGISTSTCSGCGTTKTEVLATVGHSDVFHNAGDGTHFHTCKTCTVSENLEHTPKGEGVAVAATCTEPAYTRYTCADCNGVYKVYADNATALGHNYGEWDVTAPTCSESGMKYQECTNEGCGHKNGVEIPALPDCVYEFGFYEPAPTCESGGTAVYFCKYCGKPDYRPVSATGVHNYGADVTEGDWTVKTCRDCGDTIKSFNASASTKADLDASTIDKDNALEMNMQSAAIQFPQNVVSDVMNGSEVSIGADLADETKKTEALEKVEDEEKKAAIQDAKVYDFTVTVDGTVYTENFQSKVTITLDYDNGENGSEGIVIYYLAEDGTIQEITEVVYDAENKKVTFFVEHFSFYAVAFVETQEMRCKRGVHDFEKIDPIVVEATCYQMGYTLYECATCHAKSVDHLVERTAHSYGELIPATPTCEYGSWNTKVCQNEGCGDVLHIDFVGATGHKMDAPATCDTSSTCEKCGKILARATGHAWTAWETVVEPGEVTEGLRRRNCLACGKVDEATLASSGTIEAITYDSYVEAIDLLLDAIVGEGGSILASFNYQGMKGLADVRAKLVDGKYIATVELSLNQGGGEVSIKGLYKNGIVVVSTPEGEMGTLDFDALIPYGTDLMMELTAKVVGELEKEILPLLAEVEATVDKFAELAGDEVDSVLAGIGFDYSVEDVKTLLESAETLYAYLALKLGYDTEAVIGEAVAVPTAEDVRTVLAAFMSSTTENGVTTFTMDEAPLMDSVTSLLNWLEEHGQDTVSSVIYFFIEDAALEANAEFVSLDAIFDAFMAEFPGTLTIKDAVEKIGAIAEENGVITLDALYTAIDTLALEFAGEEFNSQEFISQNGTATLDQLIQQAFEDEEITLADLVSVVKAQLSAMTLDGLVASYLAASEVPIPEDAYYVDLLREAFGMFDISYDFGISLDAKGNLVGFTASGALGMQGNTMADISVAIKSDKDVEVTIPSEFTDLIIDAYIEYAEDGSIILKGVDGSFDYSISLEGNGSYKLSEHLTLDKALSDEYGYDVYLLDKEMSKNLMHFATRYIYNGVMYDSYERVFPESTESGVPFADLIANPENYIDTSDKYHWGTTGYRDETVYMYKFYFGYVFNYAGTWMFCDYSDLYGNIVPLSEAFSEVVISNIESRGYYDENGQSYRNVLRVYLKGFEGKTLECYCTVGEGSDIVLSLDVNYKDYENSYIEFGEPAGEYTGNFDKRTEYTRYENMLVNGEVVEVGFTVVEYGITMPEYYVKVTDEIYADHSDSYCVESVDESLETVTLPSGNLLYVSGVDTDNEYAYKYGYETVYGYASTASGVYIQAYAFVKDGEVVEVVYRNADVYGYYSLSSFDLDKYFTVNNDGDYVLSAAGVKAIQALMAEEGDTAFIMLSGDRRAADETLQHCIYNIPVAAIAPDTSNMFGGANSYYDYFEKYFGYHGSTGITYTATVNPDGSLNLTFSNGVTVEELRYEFNDSLPADDILVKDEAMSEETGLDMYYYVTEDESGRNYVLIDGKYYDFDIERVYELTTSDNISDAILNGLRISNMSYRYDVTLEDGSSARVYETDVSLGKYFNRWNSEMQYSSIRLFTLLLNGRLYVAVGAEENGEGLLEFESYMPFGDYLKSLTAAERVDSDEFESDKNSYNIKLADKNLTVTTVLYDLIENDVQKYTVQLSYYLENGVRKYITDFDVLGNYLTVGEEYQLENGETASPDLWVETFYNGNATLVYVSHIYTNYYRFVKLAGRYYAYDWYYNYYDNVYLNVRIDEYQFNDQFLDKAWVYRVYDNELGDYRYYSEFVTSDGVITLVNEIEKPEYKQLIGEYYVGSTPEGNEIYEISYYYVAEDSDYTVEQLPDGTLFHHKNGDGYLEDRAGWYVPARKVVDELGNEQVVCLIRGAYIHDEHLEDSDAVSKYVTVDGNSITFSAALIELAANEQYFYISFDAEGSYNSRYYTIYYHELISIIELANKNGGTYVEGSNQGGNQDGDNPGDGMPGGNSGVIVMPGDGEKLPEGGAVIIG